MHVRRAMAVALGLSLALAASAQDVPGTADAPPVIAAVAPLDEVSMPREAGRLDEALREIRARSELPRSLRGIDERLPAEEAEVAQAVQVARTRVGAPGAAAEVRDARASWTRTLDRLSRQRVDVEEHIERLERDQATIDALHVRWTAGVARLPEGTPAALAARGAKAVTDIEAARAEVGAQLRESVDIVLRITLLEEAAAAVQDELDLAHRQRLFLRDSPPLWAVSLAPEGDTGWQEAIATGGRHRAQQITSYVQGEPERVALQIAWFGLVAVLLVRARRLPPERLPPRPEASWQTLLERPVSSAVVVALGAGTVLHARAPSAFLDLLVVIAIVPLVRVVTRLLPGSNASAILLLLGLYLANRFAPLLAGAETTFRITLVAVDALAVTGALWAVRHLARREASADEPSPRVLRWLLLAAVGALGFALLANVAGLVSLATLIVDGSIEALYIAVVLWASVVLVGGGARITMRTPVAQRLGMLRNHGPLVERRLDKVLGWVGVAAWAAYVMFLFSALEPLVSGLRGVLTATVSLGTIHLSLGSLLAFGVVLWLARSASRFSGFLLAEDVLPRMNLGRGVPATVSKLTHYAVLTLGFFFALAAAGVELTQFTFLAGAIGVGVGFGLQTIVNNFVSGLILLFERPIQEGDVIEVGTLTGTVQHIGIRACRVRTLDGAEVIVPNANLISNEVVNWTLTDNVRRFSMPVGAAYGSDPERVMTILREVAASTPGILAKPPPSALFEGFGASSVDFKVRAWAPYTEYLFIRSELALRIEKALKEAGIEIPFPQQDLHIRSIDLGAAAAMRSDGVAPVDHERVAGDPGGVVGGQEQRRGGDVGSGAEALEGDAE